MVGQDPSHAASLTSQEIFGPTCAFGALLFSSMAMEANKRICTVAPEAYQKGPETP